MDSAELLQQAIQQEQAKVKRLEDDKKALISEFSKANNYDDQMKIARDAIKDILPNAISRISHLIDHADSESVQASLSKWAVDTVLSGKLDDSTGSVLNGLLKKLRDEGHDVVDEYNNAPQ